VKRARQIGRKLIRKRESQKTRIDSATVRINVDFLTKKLVVVFAQMNMSVSVSVCIRLFQLNLLKLGGFVALDFHPDTCGNKTAECMQVHVSTDDFTTNIRPTILKEERNEKKK
jgi:hypothetical protein